MTDAIATIWRRLWYTRLSDVLRGRLDASLHWQTVIEQAELPAELADAVRQVVVRTRLWRREKVDVAAELVTHFQDGLATGRSPQVLLESFGNQRTAARLIRRAKKRGRPLIWHVWHFGWMSVVTLLLVYIAMGLWMATGRPVVKTDYLAIINKPVLAAPQDKRAWPLYRDALLAMGLNRTKDDSFKTNLESYEAKPGSEHWKETQQFLNDHANSIAQLREAAQRPTLGFVPAISHADFSAKDRELFGVSVTPEQIEATKHETANDHWLISTLLPDMQWLRTSALLLDADSRRAALAGDGKTAFDDVVAMLDFSRHSQETPFFICVLVAEAIQQKSRAAVQDILTDHPSLWSDGQLRDLAHQLAASRIDWRSGFEGERAGFYDSMQRVYTDNGHGDGRLALQVTKIKTYSSYWTR